MTRIVLCVLHFRMGARYVAADPPFTSIEMDHSDSGREGCAVSTLTVLAEPCDWRGAVRVAVQEVTRLAQFGVTPGEMKRYKAALLRDSEQLASQADSIASLDNLNFVMEYLALGHTYMQPQAVRTGPTQPLVSFRGEGGGSPGGGKRPHFLAPADASQARSTGRGGGCGGLAKPAVLVALFNPGPSVHVDLAHVADLTGHCL